MNLPKQIKFELINQHVDFNELIDYLKNQKVEIVDKCELTDTVLITDSMEYIHTDSLYTILVGYYDRSQLQNKTIMVPDLHSIIQLYTKPQLVLFDMDGLLVDTEVLWVKPYQQAYQDYGYTISKEALDATIGASGVILENILKEGQGDSFPLQKVMERADQYFFESIQTYLPTKPGAEKILKYYQDQQIPCVVASSSPRKTIEMYLSITKLTGYFSDIACLDDVKRSKPEPDIFLKGCEKMGVQPQNALVYEDSKNGIIASRRANIPVICIPDLIYHDQEIFNQCVAFTSSLENITL